MKPRTRLAIERLQQRLPFAADLHNAFSPLDVDDDGDLAPYDALLVINHLDVVRRQAIPVGSTGDGTIPTSAYYPDVTGDGQITPTDAVTVINGLNRNEKLSPPLVVSLAPGDDPDGNGVVLRSRVTIQGQTSPGTRLRLRDGSQESQFATADATGQFQFEVHLSPGDTTVCLDAVQANRGSRRLLQIRLGDINLDWNAAVLNVVRDWTTLSNDPYSNRIVTSQPPVVARNLAMIHTAMFEALNAFDPQFESYLGLSWQTVGASSIATAAAAAHRVASTLYPENDERAVFDAALNEALATVPDGPEEFAGVRLGQQIGDAMLAKRANDGANAKASYQLPASPGQWQRTFPDYYPALLPQWPDVVPFAIEDPAQFLPPPPPSIESAEYAAAVDEVMRLGSLASSTRTAEQTQIALFWADGGGTFTPPGHWNQIAADAVTHRGGSLLDTARTFALVNLAMADAGIVAWKAKYTHGLWRPIDAIRQADTDGNTLTDAVPNWTPLLRTPPFPSYTSGHSSFSAAAAAVLTALFGDNYAFTSEMDAHNGFTQRPLAADQVLTRSFGSFSAAAEEAGVSRIYGGIHFDFDNTAGLAAGRAIGAKTIAARLRPIDGPQ